MTPDIKNLHYLYKMLEDIRTRYRNEKDSERKKTLTHVGKEKRQELESLFEIYRSDMKQMDQNDEFLHLVIDVLFVV